MKASILGLSLALGLAGLATAAQADELASAPTSAAQTEQSSYAAFKSNTNPAVTVATTGPYDQEDLYVGRHGFPLGGWHEIAQPES